MLCLMDNGIDIVSPTAMGIEEDITHMGLQVTAGDCLRSIFLHHLHHLKKRLPGEALAEHIPDNSAKKAVVYIIVNHNLPIVFNMKLLPNHSHSA
jgi:hypothetical protein